MQRLLIAFVLLIVTSLAGLFAAAHFGIRLPLEFTGMRDEPNLARDQRDHKKAADAAEQALTEAAGSLGSASGPPETGNAPRLDVARISPDGTSVFAGTAQPNSRVTILADGVPIGSATADANGDWSLATETKFASKDPKLTLSTDAGGTSPPAPDRPVAKADTPAAAAANADAMRQFETLVSEARKEAVTESQSRIAVAPSPADPVKAEEARPANATEEVLIPVPIMFDYDAATMTPEGARAAKLLLEYVKLKRLEEISLSGHADERGGIAYNMSLSRARLDVVARILRDGGYTGKLDLVPKGKSEPYEGVDRAKLSADALYQIDRRVELRFKR